MATWPSLLPQSPLIDGFNRQKRQNRRSFEPEGGKSSHILFYTAVPEVLSVSFVMDETQRQTFEDFYDIDTLFGTQAFDFTDPNTGNTVNARFVGEPPNIEPNGPYLYTVSFELEIVI